TYTVTVTDANNCTALTNVQVAQPNAMQLTIAETDANGGQNNGAATVTNVSGGIGNLTYNWSTGSQSQSVTGLAPGSYTVTVTDNNGCTQTANVTVGVATGINSTAGSLELSVYPNPASTQLTVQTGNVNTETTLRMNNVLGQVLINTIITQPETSIDLSVLPNGVYFVELRQGAKSAIRQVVVNK
ncbi:MAG TPA: T9SS type A sorting domain-containing protein, partial [Chitinophagales bacterium]|nr:T9SS type A sorting domain-containing protein [Chitinophagales bacterium]